MRLAIVGSRSMLASALVRQCVLADWAVTLVGRGPDADIVFDVTAPAPAHADLAGHDVMVVCASGFGDDTIEGWRQNLNVNVLGALALVEAAIGAGIGRFLFVSSISSIDARDGYGLSKAMAESMLRKICSARNVALTIVRPAQVYDAQGRATVHQPFLYHLIEQISCGRDVSLFGGADVERNYVHVDDVAQAIVSCIRDGWVGAFNAVHPDCLKVSEVAEIIQREFGAGGRITFDPAKPDMVRITIPAEDNLFDRVGLTPRPFSEGMREVHLARSGAVA